MEEASPASGRRSIITSHTIWSHVESLHAADQPVKSGTKLLKFLSLRSLCPTLQTECPVCNAKHVDLLQNFRKEHHVPEPEIVRIDMHLVTAHKLSYTKLHDMTAEARKLLISKWLAQLRGTQDIQPVLPLKVTQKKQAHLYFDDDEIPVPVAVLQATQSVQVPSIRDATCPDLVPSVQDAAHPDPKFVPVAKHLDLSDLPTLITPDLPDPPLTTVAVPLDPLDLLTLIAAAVPSDLPVPVPEVEEATPQVPRPHARSVPVVAPRSSPVPEKAATARLPVSSKSTDLPPDSQASCSLPVRPGLCLLLPLPLGSHLSHPALACVSFCLWPWVPIHPTWPWPVSPSASALGFPPIPPCPMPVPHHAPFSGPVSVPVPCLGPVPAPHLACYVTVCVLSYLPLINFALLCTCVHLLTVQLHQGELWASAMPAMLKAGQTHQEGEEHGTAIQEGTGQGKVETDP
ncbi:hypothetical protein P4O66_003619 [Electrophorus voltai]|uniref:Uncharacterized protein n=1 Tax=Electrophorus voltai TaxID=2609070 RepID=A0AAD8ZT54_9TELE|nr:hypothetical protein P4O66_003619 [Electrophorus voltai]